MVQRQTSTLAIISLVAGILGCLPVPILGGIVAIVTGHLARAEIRREPERLQGDGMAVGGLLLGYSSLVLGLAVVVMMLVFFGGMVWLANLGG